MAIQLCFPPAKSGIPEIHVLLTHHILLCVCVLTFLAEAMQYRVPHVDQGVVLSVGKYWKMKRFFFFFFWHSKFIAQKPEVNGMLLLGQGVTLSP